MPVAIFASALVLGASIVIASARSADAGIVCSGQNVISGVLDECVRTFEVFGESVEVPAGGVATAKATCPSGSIPTGGGYVIGNTGVVVITSSMSGGGWNVLGESAETFPVGFRAMVVCLEVE